jgi:ASC-1-like (ASCH) protein
LIHQLLARQQRSAIKNGEPVLLMATEIGKEVVLLRADLYETIRELLQEEREAKTIAEIAMENALGRETECP